MSGSPDTCPASSRSLGWSSRRRVAVLDALAAGGVEARFVGGSVRDALLGRPIGDIDIATPAPPERVIELLREARASRSCRPGSPMAR